MHIIKLITCILASIIVNACSNNETTACDLLILVSCDNGVTDINATDKTSFEMLQITIPDEKSNSDQLRLRASRTSGDFAQTVPKWGTINIDDTRITGVAPVSGSVGLTYASITLGSKSRYITEGKIVYGFMSHWGLAQTLIDLTLVNDGSTVKSQKKSTELYGQGGFYFEALPSLEIGMTYSLSIGTKLSNTNEIDLLFSYDLMKNLRIMGGYRALEHEHYIGDGSIDDETSAILVKYKGPFLGVDISF